MKFTIRFANCLARSFAAWLLPLLVLLTAYGNEESIESLKKKAEAGDAKAQFDFGFMYDFGADIPENHVEAAKWYRKAAEQGNVAAQYSLGFLYERGKGVPKDYFEAAKWYRKAADRGHAGAQSSLG